MQFQYNNTTNKLITIFDNVPHMTVSLVEDQIPTSSIITYPYIETDTGDFHTSGTIYTSHITIPGITMLGTYTEYKGFEVATLDDLNKKVGIKDVTVISSTDEIKMVNKFIDEKGMLTLDLVLNEACDLSGYARLDGTAFTGKVVFTNIPTAESQDYCANPLGVCPDLTGYMKKSGTSIYGRISFANTLKSNGVNYIPNKTKLSEIDLSKYAKRDGTNSQFTGYVSFTNIIQMNRVLRNNVRYFRKVDTLLKITDRFVAPDYNIYFNNEDQYQQLLDYRKSLHNIILNKNTNDVPDMPDFLVQLVKLFN